MRCVLGQGAVTSILHPVNTFRFDVYPNPFFDHIEVSGFREEIDIELSDVHGRLLYTSRRAGSEKYVLNLPVLSKGTCILKITGQSGTGVKQLVKIQ